MALNHGPLGNPRTKWSFCGKTSETKWVDHQETMVTNYIYILSQSISNSHITNHSLQNLLPFGYLTYLWTLAHLWIIYRWFMIDFQLETIIFHSYDRLPEGNGQKHLWIDRICACRVSQAFSAVETSLGSSDGCFQHHDIRGSYPHTTHHWYNQLGNTIPYAEYRII